MSNTFTLIIWGTYLLVEAKCSVSPLLKCRQELLVFLGGGFVSEYQGTLQVQSTQHIS